MVATRVEKTKPLTCEVSIRTADLSDVLGRLTDQSIHCLSGAYPREENASSDDTQSA
jgi:hypothetical protein